MTVVRFIKKHPLCTVAMIVLVWVVYIAGQAMSSGPWWHITVMSSPPGPNTGKAMVTVDVANVGDASTNGTAPENLAEALRGEGKRQVTVVDTLPTGVTPEEAHVAGGGTEFAKREFEIEAKLGRNLCSIHEQSVTCTYVSPVRPFEQILVGIVVKVAAGAGEGVNEASVSGSSTPPAVARHALALEGPAAYGVQSYELTPEEEGGALTTQAGKHPFQLTTTLMLNTQAESTAEEGTNTKYLEAEPVALAKDLRFELPPGLAGNPTLLPKCSPFVFLQQFSKGSQHCPNDTVIGVAAPMVSSVSNKFTPYPVLSPVYSLEPPVGQIAEFGFLTIVGPAILDVSLGSGGGPNGGYDVVVSVPNIPSIAPFVGSIVTLWGVPADPRHDNSRNLECLEDSAPQESPSGEPEALCAAGQALQPFLVLPTSCTGPLRTSAQADSWSQIGQFTEPLESVSQNSLGEPYGQDGCNKLNFEPSISVAPDGQQASSPTGLTVGIHVAQDASLNPTGLAEATVRDTTVALPAGVAVNSAGADGLLACGLNEIGLDSSFEQSCPEAAKVGTLEISTPDLPNPLTGAAYLATQNANPFGSLIALYLVAKDPVSGALVKLAGEVKLDEHDGQLVSTFKETPQLPFEDLKLEFFGGARAPLGTPALCGTYTTTASIAPLSGNPPAQASSEFAITSGPKGSPCADPLPFDPSLTTGSLNIQAGAFTPFTMTMSREDGNQNLQAVQLHMPPGLSGLLTGVKLCGEAEADAGTCGPESLIGETTVSVGLGGDPYTVRGGKVYITGPYEGAPFGLSIVNPAKAGPFDLGQVVVRGRIEVNPTTAALTVTSDSTGPYRIPQLIDGIPLQIKHVNVTIDRPGFTFNPTSCQPMKVTGGLSSVEGAVSSLSVPFQVTNCARLGFKPAFAVSTSGHTSRSDGASLHVKLSYPKAAFGSQANIAAVKVDLPKQLPSRLSTLQKACLDSTFNENPAMCPAGSRVGTAKATTPLIPVPLAGPAYFVSHGGAKFPELIVVLSGYGVTIDLHLETFISKAGITSSTSRTVPDAPVGTFELTLPEGRDSALAANGNLCASTLKMPTAFTAQNGTTIHQSTPITVTGCSKHKAKHTNKK